MELTELTAGERGSRRRRVSRRSASVVWAIGVAVFAASAPLTAFAATSTTGIPIKNLGNLPGVGCCNESVGGINLAGTAAAGQSANPGHAIRFQDLDDKTPKVFDLGLGLAGAVNALALAINNDWTAVGISVVDQGSNGTQFPVRWDAHGRVFALPILPGSIGGFAYAINNKGVAGGAVTVDCCSPPAAVLWAKNGTITLLSQTGKVAGINDNGEVAGVDYAQHHAVIWDSAGVETDLGMLPGDNYSEAQGINNQGQIVGFSADSNTGSQRAVMWDASTHAITDLNARCTLCSFGSNASGIDNHGRVVGYASTQTGSHALVWYAGTGNATDLGTLPGDSGGQAVSIDNHHHVVGVSQGPTGQTPVAWTV